MRPPGPRQWGYRAAVVTGFSHVQLRVRDVATSAAWYSAVLGVEEAVAGTIASGPYVGLRHPTAGFLVGLQTATPEEAARPPAGAVDHLSFAVDDRANGEHEPPSEAEREAACRVSVLHTDRLNPDNRPLKHP